MATPIGVGLATMVLTVVGALIFSQRAEIVSWYEQVTSQRPVIVCDIWHRCVLWDDIASGKVAVVQDEGR